MRGLILVVVSLIGGTPSAFGRQEPDQVAVALFPSGYLDYEKLSQSLQGVAKEHPERMRLTSLAKSGEGRDVWLVELGDLPEDELSGKPAVLLVANLEADHVVGSQLALEIVRLLSAGDDPTIVSLFDRCRVYVVPRLNPDGAERALAGPNRINLRPVDLDRDGKIDEDGPDDLNGDGVITRMRLKDDKASLVRDEKEPRLLRKAEAAKGEVAVYSEYSEGLDDDGDEQFNEDGPGGVNLNRNWPQGWTEFDPEAGFSPASELEVRALIQFCYDHPEIAAIWSIGLNDNFRQTPKKPPSTLDDADLPQLVELSKAYAKLLVPPPPDGAKEEPAPEAKKEEEKPAEKTEEPKAPEKKDEKKPPAGPQGSSALEATTDGAMSEWAYRQFGAVAIATSLWPEPKLPDAKDGQPKIPEDSEAKWLWWNDHVVEGAAFVPFHELDHPTLGKIEVGGWRPGVRVNPPIADVEALIAPHLGLLKEIGSRVARLEISEPKLEDRGGGVFELSVVVSNNGTLPTALAQGVTTRQAPPVRVRLALDGGKLLAGTALDRVPALAGSGGKKEYHWLVLREKDGATAKVTAECPRAGSASREVSLK
jgi:Zinc carboxypeptidase